MPGSFSCSVAEMSEAGRIERRAIHTARRDLPHRRIIIALVVVAIILAVASVVSLVLGVRNITAQNAAVACQSSLLDNISAQNEAGETARAQLQTAGLVLADATEAQSRDLAALLNPATGDAARKVAAFDFQAQSTLISDAWHEYVTASKQAERDGNPTTFRC